ncbi:MAG: hypothetical protein ACO1SV_08355 [Fimbriimonas sp.]
MGTVLGLGLICLGGGYAVLYGQFGRYASHRDEELAGARREGIPIEPSDLARPIPAERNAAVFYAKACKILEGDDMKAPGVAISNANGSKASIVELRAAEKALQSLRPALDLVERGAALPDCDFNRDWSLGPNVMFPEFARLKSAAKALAVRAEIASARGDWQAALRDVRTGYRLARHTGEEPILIGMLVEVSLENITHAAFRRVVSDHGRDPAFLTAASRLQAEIGALPSLRRAMGGEVVMGRIAIPMIDSSAVLSPTSHSSGEEKPFFLERAFFKSPPVQGAFEVKLLQYWRQTYRDLPKDPADWEGGLKAMEKLDISLAADQSLANRANQTLMPVFSQSAIVVGKVIADRRLNAIALRLLEQRAQAGEFPKTLPTAWGQDAIDPFTHKPFLYRREGKGFRLWSVSADRVDDKGVTVGERTGKTHDQAVWYPVPPRPTQSSLPKPGGPGGPPAGFPGQFDY